VNPVFSGFTGAFFWGVAEKQHFLVVRFDGELVVNCDVERDAATGLEKHATFKNISVDRRGAVEPRLFDCSIPFSVPLPGRLRLRAGPG